MACGNVGNVILIDRTTRPRLEVELSLDLQKVLTMDFPEILKALDIVAWPATVIFLACLMRDRIPQLLDRIEKLEGGGFKAEFRAGLNELEKIVDSPEENTNSYAYDSKALQLQRLAEFSPNGAIVDAWREVELASISAALHNRLDVRGPKGRVSGNAAVKDLGEKSVINMKMVEVYRQLKELRNKAVHHYEQISPNEAKEYTLAALELAAQFREIRGQI